MRGRQWIAALCLSAFVLTGAGSGPARAQVKLERKLVEGTRTIVTSTRIDEKMTINGMPQSMSNDSKTTVAITVGKRDSEGKVRVQEKIDGLQVKLKTADFEYDFDSANPDKAGTSPLDKMMRPQNKAVLGRVNTTVFDKSGDVVAIELDPSLLKEVPEEAKAALDAQQNQFKAAANEELKRFPSEPVKKGDAWERTSKTAIGAGEVLTIVTRYVYEGEVEKHGRKLDRISTTAVSVTYGLENLPATVKSSELKATDSKGEILFDRALGVPVEMTSSMNVAGDVTLSAGGRDLPAKFELKMESSMVPKS